MVKFISFEEALAHLCDAEGRISSLDLHALSGPSQAEVALFTEKWPLVSAERRRHVMKVLVESAEANFELDFVSLFRYCLKDEDEEVRRQAIEGLWECEDATLVEPLVRMLRHDPSEQVRAAAAVSLSRFALQAELEELDERRSKMVIEALLETVQDAKETVAVRRRAVEAISYLGMEGVREIIQAAYNEDDPWMRASAVFAMGRSNDDVWSATVLSELSAEEPEMRFEAARACGELRLRKAVPKLIEFIQDPDREIQEAAIWALGQIGGATAKRVLESCLQSGDEVLQAAAESALAELALGNTPLLLFSYDKREEPSDEEDWEDFEDEEEDEDFEEDDWA